MASWNSKIIVCFGYFFKCGIFALYLWKATVLLNYMAWRKFVPMVLFHKTLCSFCQLLPQHVYIPHAFLRVQHFEEEKGRKVLLYEWDPLSAGRIRYKPIHFISVTDTAFSKFHYFVIHYIKVYDMVVHLPFRILPLKKKWFSCEQVSVNLRNVVVCRIWI